MNFRLLIKSTLFCLCAASLSTAADARVIVTDAGPVAGSTADNVESFKGIPYAQATVGALRWRAPQPVHPWQRVLQATAYGKDCLQEPFPGDAAPLGVGLSEDCLFVNVWRPAQSSSGKRVEIFIKRFGMKLNALPVTAKGFMRKQDIQNIISAALETADSIVGAREWRTAEDASPMHDVMFWDLLAKRLPDANIADLLSIFD